MRAETKMFDIFVVGLYLLLSQFGHVVIAKQRAVCCASRSPIFSSHNNGATLFLVGVKQLHPSEFVKAVQNVLIVFPVAAVVYGEEK